MMYEFCTFHENHASNVPLQGVYIPKSEIFSFFGSHTLIIASQISPHWWNMLPLWGEKPQNHPLS